MAAAAAALQPDKQQLLSLRDFIINDTVVLLNWSRVVDRIVKGSATVLRIKGMLKGAEYAEAVLHSLQAWYSYGDKREDLLKLFRKHEFNDLTDAVLASECRVLLQETKHVDRNGALWFEVTQVVGNFTGREAQLESVHKRLAEPHSQESTDRNVVSISGLGGIGKSTLARKYAFTYRKFYDGNVIWINAETVDSMRASFVKLSTGLGIQGGDKLSNEELAANVFECFQHKKSLFIFDNVEKLEEFKKFQPEIVDPEYETPYVLLTSREVDLSPEPENEVRLDVLTIDEAVELIQERLPKSTVGPAVKLADQLQRLPLALQQALAYIRDAYINDGAEDELILKYLKDFEESKADLLNDERFKRHIDYSETTFATWKITLTRIKRINGGDGAIKLINALAYLNPDWISVQFVRTIFEGETELGLKLLERYSMVQVSEGKVTIHRLVQCVIRLSLNEPDEEELNTLTTSTGLKLLERFSMIQVGDGKVAIHRLVQRVVRFSLSREEEGVLMHVTSAISEEFKKNVLNDLTRECASHGLHLLPFQTKYIEFMPVRYFTDLCFFLLQYGSYAEALSISQQLATVYESINGEEHESTLCMKWRVAQTYNLLKKHADAMLILNSILPTAKSRLSMEYELTMLILSTMADVYRDTGDHAKSIQIYDEIIPTTARLFGENSRNVFAYKQHKAVSLRCLGKLDEALELLYYVYEKRVSMFGKNNIRASQSKHSIACIYHDKKEFSKALEIWEEIEEVHKHVLGETHPDTIVVRSNIAAVKIKLAKIKNQTTTGSMSNQET